MLGGPSWSCCPHKIKLYRIDPNPNSAFSWHPSLYELRQWITFRQDDKNNSKPACFSQACFYFDILHINFILQIVTPLCIYMYTKFSILFTYQNNLSIRLTWANISIAESNILTDTFLQCSYELLSYCNLFCNCYLCIMKSLILTSGTLMKLLFRNGIHQLARAVGFQTCILHLWLEVQFALFLQHSKNIKKYRQEISDLYINYLTNFPFLATFQEKWFAQSLFWDLCGRWSKGSRPWRQDCFLAV